MKKIQEEIEFLRNKNRELKRKIRDLNKTVKEMKENQIFLVNRLEIEKTLKSEYRRENLQQLVLEKKMKDLETPSV